MSDDKRTATQRLEDLERVVTMLYQSVGQHKNALDGLLPLKGEMNLIKDVLKLLNKKTEAMVQVAAPETGINPKSVSDLIVKMNVADLEAQVAEYVKNGHLLPADEVSASSYVVCEESYKDGTLANPRVQFRLDSQAEALVEAMKGKKIGDTISFGEDKFDAKILEIYSVVEPKAPEAAPSEAPPAAEASAPALDALPAESPVDFALQFHGEKDPALSA